MRTGIFVLAAAGVFLLRGPAGGHILSQAAAIRPAPPAADIVRLAGYPALGKWMMSPDGGYAHWLGAKVDGKGLREPINVILVDPFAHSAEEATKRLLGECGKAGFTERIGHSGGYSAWLGDRYHAQIPAEKLHALADEPFELHNDHGRFFGPFLRGGKFYFTGALSREKLVLGSKAEHVYISFNQARDRFARAMTDRSAFRTGRSLDLDNALRDDPAVGTGDHDGTAVVLTAVR
jgi:hypothetical protein